MTCAGGGRRRVARSAPSSSKGLDAGGSKSFLKVRNLGGLSIICERNFKKPDGNCETAWRDSLSYASLLNSFASSFSSLGIHRNLRSVNLARRRTASWYFSRYRPFRNFHLPPI